MSNPEIKVKISRDWFWPSIAAMVIAGMAFGYDCHGCGDCRAPEVVPPAEKETP